MFKELLAQPRFVALVYVLGGLSLFAGCWLSLWDQDESAYAAFAWQMLETGNWLVPEFQWSEIHRKTPLYFWSIAVSNWAFGFSEWAVRLPALLSVLGTALWVGWQGRRAFGRETALAASVLLLANLFLPHLVKIAVTDAMLLFFETMAALAVINYFNDQQAKDRWWFVLGVAGALLVKGPPVLILTVGMLGLMVLFHPDRKRLLTFHLWFLFPLAALPLVAWGRLAWLTDDGVFIRWMVDWYTFRRVGGEVLGQTGPPGYYLLTLLIAFLPWTMLLPKAFRDLIVHFRIRQPEKSDLYLLAWLISGWLIYELLRSKLPAYALGAYPAMALLLGRTAVRLREHAFRNETSLKIGIGLYLLLASALGLALPLAVKPLVGPSVLLWAWAIAGFFMLSAIWVALQAWWSHYNKVVGGILVQTFGFLGMAWLIILPGIEPLRGATKQLAKTLEAEAPKTETVYFTRNFQLPTLPYYLAKAGFKRGDAYRTDEWAQILNRPEQVVLIFNDEDWATFTAMKLNYRVVASYDGWISDRGRFTHWYAVSNR